METTSGYIAAGGALFGAILALVIYHFSVVRMRHSQLNAMLLKHDAMMGGDGAGAASRLTSIEAELSTTNIALQGLSDRVAELEARSVRDISHAGFIRYDAFDDTKSDLSYALALLNREGDGIVLSSLYSRSDTRTYGKAVAKFVPLANASEEELQAIERAKSPGKP